MDPTNDSFMELIKIQQDAHRGASLNAELFTLQKMVMHLQSEIVRVQTLIDETPVGKIMKQSKVSIFFPIIQIKFKIIF